MGVVGGLAMAVENRSTNRRVVDRLDLHPGDRVLEIGCGPGVAARTAARRVAPAGRVVAVDPSATVLRVARLLTDGTIRPVVWRLGSAELPVEDASIDVAFTINSWHHWTDPQAAINELARVLAPGGRAVIVERTEQSRHLGAHGLDADTIDALAAQLHTFGAVDVQQLRAGREVLVLVTSRGTTSETANG
jgi:ubiquinone/menaquinone biosynthesis C-methylase UbiE